jgi:hypothetical protein
MELLTLRELYISYQILIDGCCRHTPAVRQYQYGAFAELQRML